MSHIHKCVECGRKIKCTFCETQDLIDMSAPYTCSICVWKTLMEFKRAAYRRY